MIRSIPLSMFGINPALRAQRFIVVCALPIVLAGCAGLSTQSFLAPGAGHKTYDGFMAYAAFSDLAVEGAYEHAMCQRLLKAGHACNTMLQLASPTAPQNGASRQQAAMSSGAQAIVFIELANPKSESRRILDNGRPGYRVSLIDAKTQKVVARLAVDARRKPRGMKARAKALANAVVRALAQRKLLTQKS